MLSNTPSFDPSVPVTFVGAIDPNRPAELSEIAVSPNAYAEAAGGEREGRAAYKWRVTWPHWKTQAKDEVSARGVNAGAGLDI